MSDSFRITALPAEPFAALFAMSDEELASIGARRVVADDKPGFPCRVSLTDAEIGETVILISLTHHDVASPYRGSSPIFVRRGVAMAEPAPGEIPAMLRSRLLSVRAFDEDAMMVDADVVEGRDLEAAITRMFTDGRVRYLHLHNARPGCYNCAVVRV